VDFLSGVAVGWASFHLLLTLKGDFWFNKSLQQSEVEK